MVHEQKPAARARQAAKAAALGAALALGVAATPARALTVIINFANTTVTDLGGVTTSPYNFSSWGFSYGDDGIHQAALESVLTDYLAYPNVAQNPLSPLPVGQQLNIDFEFSVGQTGPTNGDLEYYYVNVGTASLSSGILGQAICIGCVRRPGGGSTVPFGSAIASVAAQNIDDLLNLATNDTQRINLLAGTVAHEIGHPLNLQHPAGQLPNPGQSLWSIMGSGASNMPNGERIKDRAFAYTEFNTLINGIGLVPVPEPATWAVMVLGLGVLGWRLRGRRG